MLGQFDNNSISILDIFHCPHGPESKCICSKPKPGMFIDAKNKSSKHILKYYNTYCTDTRVHFELFMDESVIEKLDVMDWNSNMTKLEKTLKLCSLINLSNMVLYDKDNKIKKYKNVNDIITEFCGVRLEYYTKRKNYLINELEEKINLLEYKIKFINEFINETIKIFRVKRNDVLVQLKEKQYPLIENKYDLKKKKLKIKEK